MKQLVTISDLEEFLSEYGGPHPSEIHLPPKSWNNISAALSVVTPGCHGWDANGEFVFYRNTKMRPPKVRNGWVADLSDEIETEK